MKPKTLILMVVAVGCGLVAALLVKYGMTKETKPTEQYLAANADMGPGTKITSIEEQFHPKDYLPGTAPPGALKNDDETRAKLKNNPVLSVLLPKDEVLTTNHITDVTITAKLKGKEIAMAVPVSVNNAVAGFLQPEAHVDLLLTYTKGAERVVTTFLRNVRIVAVNQMFNKPADAPAGAAAANLATITVAVEPDIAAKITWAMAQGSLTLTLRQPGDGADDDVTDVKDLSPSKKKGTEKGKTEKVLVARNNIAKGTKIDTDLFEEKDIPKSEQNSRFYKPGDTLPANGIMLVALDKDDLLEKKLVGEPVGVGAASSIETHQMMIINGTKEPIVAKFQRVVGSGAWSGSGLPDGLRSNMTVPELPPVAPPPPAPGTITITPPTPSGAAPKALPTLGAGTGGAALNGN